ncbi:transcription factor MafB [Exaiptasia diaphana]|uniref:Neural retina-specific leucine zipper protein n=1 Tax=Exaiptasia diaphana TaxID=2652724 RepID=A0A913XH47_EXADI|nr:transcription factor MafB [Exaiptasia diaphana]KXJ11853.1 Transcription factor Maf [Exaiptasia diaphana]
MEDIKTEDIAARIQLEQLRIMADNWESMDDFGNGEALQSVPEQDPPMPFLHGSSNMIGYPTLGSSPNWMNLCHINELSTAPAISEASSPYVSSELSPAPSSVESFAFTDYENYGPLDMANHSDESVENFRKIITRLGVTEKKIQDFGVKELNRFLKSNGLTKEEQKCLKNRRRTLKNRGYAQNCRIKRIRVKKSLETENEDLRKEIDDLKSSLDRAKKERDAYKRRLEDIIKFFKDHKKSKVV